MSRDKREVVVAAVKSYGGDDVRIHLLTSADAVHLFALAMGYTPIIAFSFGVISRSLKEVQSGKLDVSIEQGKKMVQIAAIIADTRVNGTLPEDHSVLAAIWEVTSHVHMVEECYNQLLADDLNLKETLVDQYTSWLLDQITPKPSTKKNFVRRFLDRLIKDRRNEQKKHS